MLKVYTFNADGPALMDTSRLDVPSGPRFGWADAAPLTGYWRVGDILLNAHANESIKLWNCVEEGTPGVWVGGSSGGGSSSLASDVLYDNTASDWISQNVQDCLDEISARVVKQSDIRSFIAAGGLVAADSQSVSLVVGGLRAVSGGPGIKNIAWDAIPDSTGYIIQVSAKNSAERFNATIANFTPGTTSAIIKTYNAANAPADTEVFVTIISVKP